MATYLECYLGSLDEGIVDSGMTGMETVGDRDGDISVGVLANHVLDVAYLKLIAILVEIAGDDAFYP